MNPKTVVAIGVVFTAFSAILVRLSDAPALVIAAYRMGFTSLLVSPLLIRELARGDERPAKGRPLRRSVFGAVASGAFLAAHFAFWITSLDHTSVASSTVLVTAHPIIVALLSFWLFRERITQRGILLMVCALGGGVLLAWGGFSVGGSAPLGNLLAFAGALMVAVYIVIGRMVRRHLSVNRYTAIAYPVSFALLVVATLAAGVRLGPYPLREYVIFAALALFCTLLGHSLFNWALKYVSGTVIATSILGEPVIATLLALAIFGEVPSATTIGGGAIILASIYLFAREQR